MEETILTVTLDSCWSNADEVRNFKRKMKHYGIEATFHDGGDHYSTWSLTGAKDDLRKAINDNWLMHGLNAAEDVMNQETMNLLGFEMSEEGKIDLM